MSSLVEQAEVCSLNRALVLRRKWIDQILSGERTIDIRGRRSRVTGLVYLCEAKTGKVRGVVKVAESRPLTVQEEHDNFRVLADLGYAQPWGKPLSEATRLAEPWVIPAAARRGCPQWIPRKRWELALEAGAAVRLRNVARRPAPKSLKGCLFDCSIS